MYGLDKIKIGLIDGIGPVATALYYRRLISKFAIQNAALDLGSVHADRPTFLKNLSDRNATAQVAIYTRLTNRLAGAGFVAVTSIADHSCIEEFKAVSGLPVVDLISEVNAVILQRGLKCLGIPGTSTVMETNFHGGIAGADIIAPGIRAGRVVMAASAMVTDPQRDVFWIACRELISASGVAAIMLVGTGLAMVFYANDPPAPVKDAAGIHADAIAILALP